VLAIPVMQINSGPLVPHIAPPMRATVVTRSSVIAIAAKQSRVFPRRILDCFAKLAMTGLEPG